MDRRRPMRSLLALLLILPIASAVQAGPVTFTGSSGLRAASVTFANAGGNLQVTLTNTSTADCLVPIDILTGVFFDVSNNPTLTQISATIAAGSFRVNTNGNAPVAGNVGGEWDYARANSGTLSGVTQKQGISSSGLGIFADGSFNGPELDGPPNSNAVDGMQYGLLSAGDNIATGNSPLFSNDFVKNSVVFTLSGIAGLNDNTDLATMFSNIRFQYGTSLSEPSFSGGGGGGNPVPVPAGVLLMGLGGICLAGYNIRRNRKVAKLS